MPEMIIAHASRSGKPTFHGASAIPNAFTGNVLVGCPCVDRHRRMEGCPSAKPEQAITLFTDRPSPRRRRHVREQRQLRALRTHLLAHPRERPTPPCPGGIRLDLRQG